MDATFIKQEPLDVLVPFVETSVDPLAHLKMEQICRGNGSTSAPGIFTEELQHSTSNPIKTEPTDVLNEVVAEQHQDSKEPLKDLVPFIFKQEQICEGDDGISPTVNIKKEFPLTTADPSARSLIIAEASSEVEEHQDFLSLPEENILEEPLDVLVPFVDASVDPLAHLNMEQIWLGDGSTSASGIFTEELQVSTRDPIETQLTEISYGTATEQHHDSKEPLKDLVPFLFKQEEICEGGDVNSPIGNIKRESPVTAADSSGKNTIKAEPSIEVEEQQDFGCASNPQDARCDTLYGVEDADQKFPVPQPKQREKRRKCWVKKWLQRRNDGKGALSMLTSELLIEDPISYKNYLRMDNKTFNKLLSLLGGKLTKNDTVMRESISPEMRLQVTLRFLASGESFTNLAYSTRIGRSTISSIILDTLKVIYESLKNKYLNVPLGSEWICIAKDFEMLWQFPHCLGALDGKHVNFRPPKSAGSYYYNYKGSHSIILMALVSAKYEFLMIDVGKNGRMSDGGVFNNSAFYQALRKNQLKIPEAEAIQGQVLPYVIVADDAFALHENIMKPYKKGQLSKEEIIFNYRLSRARRVVENAFGILANRFRILLQTINLIPEKVELIVLSACAIHNFLIKENPSQYLLQDSELGTRSESTLDSRKNPGLRSIGPSRGNHSSATARAIRDSFCTYFNSSGSVPWQHDVMLNH